MKSPRWEILMPWLLLALALLVYGPALEGGFIWDDESHVTHLESLRSAEGLRDIWTRVRPPATPQYYPLTFTVFWIQYRLWGLNPFGYHLVNVLLHAINGFLIWKLVRRMRWPGAGWAAVLFVAHPVLVMSVAWITELKNGLAGFFMLASLLACGRHAGWGEEGASHAVSLRGYLLALLFFFAAVLSKTPAGLLPLAFLLLTWLDRRPLGRAFWLRLVPFVALGVFMGFVTVSVEQVMGTAQAEFQWPWANRLILAGRSFWFYLGKLLWPARLLFIYPEFDLRPAHVWNFLWPVSVALVMALLWRQRGRIGREPLAAAVWFFLSGPAIALLHVLYMMQYTHVADHWQYFAAPAILILTAQALSRVAARGRAGTVAAGILVAVLGVRTHIQCRMYRDPETLWTTTLAGNPEAWMAHNNLGQICSHRGQLDEALWHYEEALRRRPENPDVLNNIATVWTKRGQLDRAAETFYRILVRRPAELAPRNNLANTLALMGDKPGAVMHYRELLRYHPDQPFPQVHFLLGKLLLELGEPGEAVRHLRTALELQPGYPEAAALLEQSLNAEKTGDESSLSR